MFVIRFFNTFNYIELIYSDYLNPDIKLTLNILNSKLSKI